MINFVIYENELELKNSYEMIILSILGNKQENFKIIDYLCESQKNCDRNIYILSSEDIFELLEIAKKIRDSGDWTSKIIIISNLEKVDNSIFSNRLLILDYINYNYNDNINDALKRAICVAYKILTKNKTLNFRFNGETYRIPYQNILFIEKGNNLNYCTIYTKHDNQYIIKETINNLEEKLDSAYFMKTHRSCIVNLYNILYYNYADNIIKFKNKQIDLIAREKRQILKSKLIEEKIENETSE